MHKLGYSWVNGNCRLCEKEFVKNNKFQVSCSQACASKFWVINNPEKMKRANERRKFIRKTDIWVKLGITHDIYSSMMKEQGGVCAICGGKETQFTPKTKRRKRLAVDHDHLSGKVRGLLCDKCNRGLGMFKDSKQNLSNAILYLGNATDDRPIVDNSTSNK